MKKRKIIIDSQLECGCKYQHYTNASEYKFWERCAEAERLKSAFFKTWSIEDRNAYHQHYDNQ